MSAIRRLATIAVTAAAVVTATAGWLGQTTTADAATTATTTTTATWTQTSAWCLTTADGVGCVAIDRSGTHYRSRFSLRPASGHALTPVGYNGLQPEAGGPDQPFCQTGCHAVHSLWTTTKDLGGPLVAKFVYGTSAGNRVIYTGATAITPPFYECKDTPAGKICSGGGFGIVAKKGVGYDRMYAYAHVAPTGGQWIAPETVRYFDGSKTFYSTNFCRPHCTRHTTAWSWRSPTMDIAFSAFPHNNQPVQTAFKVSANGTVRTIVGH